MAFLSKRVKDPDEDDWIMLRRVLKYLNGTVYLSLTLDASKIGFVQLWVDASFDVCKDYCSHTNTVMLLGYGAATSMSKKQRINTKSLTEAEVVEVDDASPEILWTNYFVKAQGYDF